MVNSCNTHRSKYVLKVLPFAEGKDNDNFNFNIYRLFLIV